MRLLAFLAVAAALNVHAQAEPRTYAILSLLGDRMTLVVHVPTAGTNMGSERRSVIKLTTPVLDFASGRVIAERLVYGATAIATHSAVSPWEELTPEQKVDALRSLLKREIAKAVPPLLSGAP